MLTIEDCIGLSELTEEEVQAIAEHEHLPQIVAAELGSYLVRTPEGELRISAMIRDDIDHATSVGDFQHAALLKLCLRHFVEHHPCADRS
ncbi:MAG: hypothetical protein GC151_01995 [Betaproteobacteria bacterium]|nr:hypothetical protein [Betaproteobacteria bacterium]